MSANVHRARSIKIGKYSMRKFGERGFRIITPEGKDYFFEGSLLHRQTVATYVWAAALAKCNNNQKEANLLLKKLNLENLTATKSKSRYESAKERVLSKSKKIHIQKNNDIER